MAHKIKTVYLVQHSHTDIGYTDLQEHIVNRQIENIRSLLRTFRDPDKAEYRWVCETFYVVEKFLDSATDIEKKVFFDLVKEEKIGLSFNYLNFTDLVDGRALRRRLAEARKRLADAGVPPVRVAMCADVNGLSMGQRDALLDSGVEFLYMNVNATHGNPPFNKRHIPFRWEAADGRGLLVWSAEHYNLGNALGFRHECRSNPFFESFVGKQWKGDPAENIHDNLEVYLNKIAEKGYPYPFLPVSVSGLFTDNAPHNTEILRNIRAYRERFGASDDVDVRMVTLEEMYREIRDSLGEIPVVRGDMADWWVDGVGCVPFAVEHYREARRLYHTMLDAAPDFCAEHPDLVRTAEENMLVFAEHTYGHSATATDPCDRLVRDLDFRNQCYASLAHSAVMNLYDRFRIEKGGTLRLFGGNGTVEAYEPGGIAGSRPICLEVERYPAIGHVSVTRSDGREMITQTVLSARGRKVFFIDDFEPFGRRRYTFRECGSQAPVPDDVRVSETSFENAWILIGWDMGGAFTSWFDKAEEQELISTRDVPFMTPVYEVSPQKRDAYQDRGMLGKNIRGDNFRTDSGKIVSVKTGDSGPLFTDLLFDLSLDGARKCREILRVWHTVPTVDVWLQLCKEPAEEIESVYMSGTLEIPGAEIWIRKGGSEIYRPGVDQIPMTCPDYTASDTGILYLRENGGGYAVSALDSSLLAFAPFTNYPVTGCDPDPGNAKRPVRLWLMNNKWETNFTLDLSGFIGFAFRFEKTGQTDPEKVCDAMEAGMRDTVTVFREETGGEG